MEVAVDHLDAIGRWSPRFLDDMIAQHMRIIRTAPYRPVAHRSFRDGSTERFDDIDTAI